MKSPLKLFVAAVPSPSAAFLRGSALGAAMLALFFFSDKALGQGAYYPVNPAGQPYGTNYTGITVGASPDLSFLQLTLQELYGGNLSLEVPVPTGSVAPSTTQYSTAVGVAIDLVLAGAGPGGVSLTSLSKEAVAWNPTAYGTTSTAIAQSIVQFNAGTAVANLTTVANALATSQPTLINNIIADLVIQAGTNTSVAQGIPQIVAAAVADVETNTTAVNSIVNNGIAYGINASSLTAAAKSTLFIGTGGYVQTLLSPTLTNNNQAVIDAISTAATFTNFLGLVNPATGATNQLTQILESEITGLGAGASNNILVGAIADGALRSEGANYASTIATALATNAPTANYTNAVVQGYSNSSTLANFQAAVTGNPTLADALAAGAVVKASLTPATVLQWALTDGTAIPRNVVAAAVGANLTAAMTTLVGAINTSTHTPYGSATFGDIAYGAAEAAPLSTAGNVTQTVLLNSATSVTALSGSVVTQVVTNALNGANAGNNQSAFAALIYGTQFEAKYTSPGTNSNPGIAAVQAAVDTLSSIANPNYPSYLAVVAAVAGDTYGYNHNNIQAAGDSELTTDSGDTVAAIAGGSLVQALQQSAATTFTSMITAFQNAQTNGSPTNSAIALLYGATMADPTEYAAALASAIKQSTVSDTTLTAAANSAILTSSPNLSQNIAVVDTLVEHLKTEADSSGGITDLFGYVGHQIVINPSLTQTIAAAATVLDPDNAHFIAHSVAFNNPASVYLSVPSIFTYAQITNAHPLSVPTVGSPNGVLLPTKSSPGSTLGVIVDQPAAAAAITAGLTSGILEANLPSATTKTDLVNTITAAVAASATQNGVNLLGPLHPFTGDAVNIFQQSDGTVAGTVSNYRTVGAAGAITGFVAQMVQPGDSTINSITSAVLGAASAANVRAYALAIAQAAAQALRWVGGTNVSTALAGPMVAGNPAYDIAAAMATTVVGFATMTQLENAASFGINQAAAGVIGAGAIGLNANGINPGTGSFSVASTGNSNSAFYQVRSATGTPVTDIFNL